MPNNALRKVTNAATFDARDAFFERCRTFSITVSLHVSSVSSGGVTSMIGSNLLLVLEPTPILGKLDLLCIEECLLPLALDTDILSSS